MFKGANSMTLSEATVIAALQEYLDKRITGDSPVVAAVWQNNASGTSVRTFLVQTTEAGKKP